MLVDELVIDIPMCVPPKSRNLDKSAWQKIVADAVDGRRVNAKFYEVELTFVLGAGNRGDLDNLCKAVIDMIAKAGAIYNDSRILDMRASKVRGIQGRTLVKLRGAERENKKRRAKREPNLE